MLSKIETESRILMEAKNHDYRGGTGDPYANFRRSTMLGIDPVIGIMLRMCDKHMRLRTFLSRGILKVTGESTWDCILDLHNYTILAYGMQHGWDTFELLMKGRHSLYVDASAYLNPEIIGTAEDMLDNVERLMQQYLEPRPEFLAHYTHLALKLTQKDFDHG